VLSKDAIFDEEMRSSSSQDSPSVIKERQEVVPETDSNTQDELDSEEDEVRIGLDMPSPSTPTHRRPRWLTQRL
jgi:hypothetical protein